MKGKHISSSNDILCEYNTDQSVYLVFTHIIGTKEVGEAYNHKYPRYITLSKEKAKRYMQACGERIQLLSRQDKDTYFIHEVSDNKIVYSAHDEEKTYIMTIYLQRYSLDFAFSEF